MPPRICQKCDKISWKKCNCNKSIRNFQFKKLLRIRLDIIKEKLIISNEIEKEELNKEMKKIKRILEIIKF